MDLNLVVALSLVSEPPAYNVSFLRKLAPICSNFHCVVPSILNRIQKREIRQNPKQEKCLSQKKNSQEQPSLKNGFKTGFTKTWLSPQRWPLKV